MRRLIDIDALIESLHDNSKHKPFMAPFKLCTADIVDLKFLLNSEPTVDAVTVVRCRECKHWKKGEFQAGDDVMHLEYGGYCPNSRFARYESDFCSYGERKEGAD